MKKFLLPLLLLSVIVAGCGTSHQDQIYNTYKNEIENKSETVTSGTVSLGDASHQDKVCNKYRNEIEKKLETLTSGAVSLDRLFYSPVRQSCIVIEIDNVLGNYEISEYPEVGNGNLRKGMWLGNDVEAFCNAYHGTGFDPAYKYYGFTGSNVEKCIQLGAWSQTNMDQHIQMIKGE